MKKLLVTILLVLLVGIAVNDVSRYAKAQYDLGNIATDTAYVATRDRNLSRDENAMLAAQFASELGATVYQFDQDDNGVHIWLQMPVEGTWILRPLMSLTSDQGVDAPFYVERDEIASFR